MIEEYQKYKADFYKISGFALMTPLGRFVLDIMHSNFADLTLDSLSNFSVSLLLFLIGIMFVQIGYEALIVERKNEH